VLCEFANRFPQDLADIMERDRHLTRNFREESATDLLMMGLVPLEPMGVRVDYPIEPVTGADMDWIYAAPHEISGGMYLRLMIQAKRAKEQQLKDGTSYWYYDQLDHGDPKGSQAQTLVAHAATSPDGMETLPLYMFYHPSSALRPAAGYRPAIEGVNVTFACDVAPVVAGGCGREKKRVGFWRDGFMSLSDLLCWPLVPPSFTGPPPASRAGATEFLSAGGLSPAEYTTVMFHPELVAERLNSAPRRPRTAREAEMATGDGGRARPASQIPEDIRRAIDGKVTREDRERLKRPRVILSTNVTRDQPTFRMAQEFGVTRPHQR
jgi:hypothetical protein